MRQFSFFFLLLLLACDSPSPVGEESLARHPEAEALIQCLQRFFYAASQYDFQDMQAQCEAGFRFSEGGKDWSLEELRSFMEPDRGKVLIQYELKNPSVQVKLPLAWVHYQNQAVQKENQQTKHINWRQSAVLKKENEGWKLVRIESTRLNTQVDIFF